MPERSSKRHLKTIGEGIDEQPKEVNPFSALVENLCDVQDLDVKPLARPHDGRVRVALVSMPSFEEDQYRWKSYSTVKTVPYGIRADDCERSLVELRGDLHKKLLTAYKEALTFAVEELGAHIICVSELGLPHYEIKPLTDAQQFASDLSTSHDVLIVAGTSHDKRTYYNTGYIYHPDGNSSFHKTLSAADMGELISAPAKRRVLSVKTLGLRVAVMICLDIADYATLASVIRAGEKVDLVLVPCYTTRFDKMVSVAKVASGALRGIVALVNANLPGMTCRIARFGKDVKADDEHPFDSGAVVSLFEVNHETLQEERNKKHVRENRYVNWLFGRREMRKIAPNPPLRPRVSNG